MSKHWEPCPRCNSNKVTTTNRGVAFLIILFAAGLFMFVGFIIWPLLIVTVLLLLASPTVFFLPKSNTCGDCKYSWKVNKHRITAPLE